MCWTFHQNNKYCFWISVIAGTFFNNQVLKSILKVLKCEDTQWVKNSFQNCDPKIMEAHFKAFIQSLYSKFCCWSTALHACVSACEHPVYEKLLRAGLGSSLSTGLWYDKDYVSTKICLATHPRTCTPTLALYTGMQLIDCGLYCSGSILYFKLKTGFASCLHFPRVLNM